MKQRTEKLSNIKHIIAITASKGGVGKSTISANIACELATQTARVGILDGDIYAPTLPTIFDLEQTFMEAETDQHGRTTAFPVIYSLENSPKTTPVNNSKQPAIVKVASMGFVINKNTAVAWRGHMLGNAFNMFLQQIEWGELDYLIVDLPPSVGDVHFNFIAQLVPDGIALITTPNVLSLHSVRRDVNLFKQMNVPILGIIENMSYFVPPNQPNKQYEMWGDCDIKKIFTELNIPTLGKIPFCTSKLSDNEIFTNSIKNIVSNFIAKLQ